MSTPVFEKKRPPGRPPMQPPARLSAQKLYDRVKPLLTPDLRDYLESTLNGDGDFDGMQEMELLLKQLSLYTNSVIGWAQEDGIVTRDVAAIIAEFRMAIKDHEQMRVKRMELDEKYGNSDRVVEPTRKPALARFEALHGDDS